MGSGQLEPLCDSRINDMAFIDAPDFLTTIVSMIRVGRSSGLLGATGCFQRE
jgi:hypothetical protein